ncbi:hypothetical protein PENTCL1PPCAC_21345, partial [Pristionchus entomophagus]
LCLLGCSFSNAQWYKPKCNHLQDFICGSEKHVVTKDDCERGLKYINCVKIIEQSNVTHEWNRTSYWHIFIVDKPIQMRHCLALGRSHLMIVCGEERCDVITMEEQINNCISRSPLMHHFPEANIPPKSFGFNTHQESDAYYLGSTALLALILVVTITFLLLSSARRYATRLANIHEELSMSTNLPTNLNSSMERKEQEEEEEYDVLKDDNSSK